MGYRRLLTATPLVLGLLAVSDGAPAQALRGRVFDGYTGQAVAGVEVAVLEPGGDPVGLARSDSTGAFHVPLERAGAYRLTATAPGYDLLAADSFRVAVDQEVIVELRLGPRPFEVDGLTVVARRSAGPLGLQEFRERLERHRKTGRGTVLTREALDRHIAQTGARALARESIHVREYAAYGGGRVEVRRLGARFDGPPWCEPALFLDGLPVDVPTLRSIPASSLAGVELYRGVHEVPARYLWVDNATTCGVILAWMRRDGGGRSLLDGDLRPFQAGALIAGVTSDRPDGSLDLAAVGLELERGLARSMVGWIQLGLTRPAFDVICAPGIDCAVGDAPWMAVVGGSLFPTGTEVPVAPYVGGGVGLASPGTGMEATHLFRVGIELIRAPVHLRFELRTDPNGWGAGLGVMF